jgi:carboxypeptidase C (cathepsin A)
MTTRLNIAVCVALLTMALVAAAESLPGAAAPIATRHTAQIGTQQVAYTASFAATVLKDDKGVAQATISATSYTRDGVADTARRPVIFLFNGGPGASSSPLHFSALGPRRIVETEGRDRRFIDNDESPLDVADLVFIDPVGTGFSRVLAGGAGTPYWTMDGDARAALALVRDWLRVHGRGTSPVYLAGQSYGGFRLAMMTKYAQDLPLAGLILVSPMLDASGTSEAAGNDLPYVLNLPTMSALAWHHQRIARNGRTLEAQFEEAARFAQGEYASALMQGSALPAVERGRIAARMAALTGLPEKAILAADLRMTTDAFRSQLLQSPRTTPLAEAGQEIGRLDGRIIAGKRPPRTAAQPSGDPSLVVSGSRADFIKAYYRDTLQVPETAPYVTLSFAVNGAWNWQAREGESGGLFYLNAAPHIAALMRQQPTTRLMLAGGYYDLAVSYLGARYVLAHAGIAPGRIHTEGFAAGHSPYDDAPGLHQFAAAIRAFASPQPSAN